MTKCAFVIRLSPGFISSTRCMTAIFIVFIIILICIFFLSFYFSKYYEKDALLADPVEGPILASLLGKKLIEMSVLFF